MTTTLDLAPSLADEGVVPPPPAPMPAAPINRDGYWGLLTEPEGLYGLTSYGNTHAVTLTGSPDFRRRAFNLFASFGGESVRSGWMESRVPTLHDSERPDTVWFCLPKHRVISSLTLFFYGQLWGAKGERCDIVDDEGDRVCCNCLNEDALMAEAEQLAARFVATEMRSDSAALPSSEWASERAHPTEHGVATGWGTTSED